MNTREWALIIFTILGQLSVGTLLVLLIVRAFLSSKLGAEKAARLTNVPMYGVVVTMGLALIASLFHLGKVTHVIGAVPNLGTSWMSREVVSSVAFAVLVALFALLEWRKIASEGLRLVVAWVAVLVGLFLLVCMSQTYMLPAEPAWNTAATPIQFFATALLLGVLGSAVALVANRAAVKEDAAVDGVLRSLALSAIVLVGVELIVTPLYMAYLAVQGPAAVKSLGLMAGTYGLALVIRFVLVFLGAGYLAAHLYRNAASPEKKNSLATLVYVAFVLVLTSEVLGRFLFYATRVRIGV
jgi:anaerobic dimethyl sulfoxide reductase subunit C (anchor subunit)